MPSRLGRTSTARPLSIPSRKTPPSSSRRTSARAARRTEGMDTTARSGTRPEGVAPATRRRKARSPGEISNGCVRAARTENAAARAIPNSRIGTRMLSAGGEGHRLAECPEELLRQGEAIGDRAIVRQKEGGVGGHETADGRPQRRETRGEPHGTDGLSERFAKHAVVDHGRAIESGDDARDAFEGLFEHLVLGAAIARMARGNVQG